MSVSGYKFTSLTGGGTGALDARDGADLTNGDLAIVMTGGLLYHYELDDDSGAAESSPYVIAPDTNAGTKRWIVQRIPAENQVPVGAVVAFVGGYFTDGSNGGFTNVLGNTAAAINAAVNTDGWYVCNGAALNLSGSPIFDGASRYLPNLTDSRFLMGSTSAGTIGGAVTHTHTTESFTLTINEMPSHQHATNLGASTSGSVTGFHTFGGPATSMDKDTDVRGGGASHNHGATASASNNPVFMACFYLIKAI